MKCRYCGSENIIKAEYCSSCGKQIPEEDRKKAWNATIYGKIEMLENARGWITLGKITGHPVVRVLMLVLILAYGLLFRTYYGNTFSVRSGDDYTLAYNRELDEYYIGSENAEFDLNLYVPGKAESILVDTVRNADQETVISEAFAPEDAIALRNMTDRHYILTADYGSRQRQLVIYIVREEELL
ncbi:MAG: zinc ribbon domain-containing protein [Firmicutes bacterium]|nr:zinc ribbon domain-containing protein [Bacillota bacterium]